MQYSQQAALPVSQVSQFGCMICREPGAVALDSLSVANVSHAPNGSLESFLIRSFWAKFNTSQATQRGPSTSLIEVAERATRLVKKGLDVDRAKLRSHLDQFEDEVCLTPLDGCA